MEMDLIIKGDLNRISKSISKIIYIIPDYEAQFKEWLFDEIEEFPDGNTATQEEYNKLDFEFTRNSCFWNSQQITLKTVDYLYYEGFVLNDDSTTSMHHGFNSLSSNIKDFSALCFFPTLKFRYYGVNIPKDFIKDVHSSKEYEKSREENPNYIPFCPILHTYFYFCQGIAINEAVKYTIADDTIFF